MKIERIRIKNFRVFRDLTLTNIPALAVFVGANGVGKSTLFRVFGFLKDALKNNVRTALQKEGGFDELVSRGHEKESIEIEIQFRMELTGRKRLVSYLLSISKQDGKPVIDREILRYKRGRYGSPFHFLDFSKGEGYAITNEEDFTKTEEELTKESQKLDSPDILAIKGLGQFQRFKAASAFRNLIENWHVSDFHITDARQRVEAGVAEHLSESGDNLPIVAQHLYENHRAIFDTVLKRMESRIPGISEVTVEQTIDGHVVLRFKDGSFKNPFIARYVSDGTIKMFAYLILLYDPNPHPFLCIEEPENQLYPALLEELAEELRSYAQRGGQVLVSTHSPEFLNAVELSEVFWLNKKSGFTNIYPLSNSELISNLIEAGDKPGYLWSQGIFSDLDQSSKED